MSVSGAVAGAIAVALLVAGLTAEPASSDPLRAERVAAAGERVEVLGKRTENSQTFANPDGSYTLEQSSQPVRTRRNGGWVDLDPTLQRGADGLIRPRATAMEMAFSGGGSAPLVTTRYDGQELCLSWPSTLPAPTIQGDSLLYPSVLPDVDLKVTVTTTSFSEVLIVRTPQAADLPQLRQITLGIDAPGLAVRVAKGGGVEAIDQLGRAVFSAPQPSMWDSSGDAKAEPPATDRTEAPLEGDKVVAMPVEVSQDSLTVTPSGAFADDPAAEYPIHIDPALGAPQSGRAMINQHYPSTSTYNWTTPEGVGYQAFEPWSRKRLFFQFYVGAIPGAHVRGATFSAFETWAASCTPKEVQAWKTVKFGPAATWNSGSGSNVWLQRLSSVTAAHGRNECDPGGKWLSFPVTSAVAEQVAARNGYVYLGLRAADEADQYAWKRFHPNVKLAIDYNHPPAITGRSMDNPDIPCVTSAAAAPLIGSRYPIPSITIGDEDAGQSATADFEIYLVGESQPRWQNSSATKVPVGATFAPQRGVWDDIFGKPLTAGVVWAWRARARDGVDATPWTSFCYFKIDVSHPPPPTITVVTPEPHSIGQPITVRLGPNGATDVAHYRIGLNDDAPTSGNISASSPTYTFTPPVFGPFVVYAWSFDRVPNQSGGSKQFIRVANASESGKWLINEGSGATLADSSGQGHPMYTSADVTWAAGNKWPDMPNDYAVTMNGLGGTVARTSAYDVVNTDRNFSVAAKVRLGLRSVRQSVLSEDRAGMSAFTLGVYAQSWAADDTDDRHVVWEFAIPDPDGSGEIVARSAQMPYQPGDWVHLTGTYDAAEDKISLYVNDLSPRSTAVTNGRTPADGTGPFKVGQDISAGTYNHYLLGQVDDVRIFNGAVDLSTTRTLTGQD